MIYNHLNVMKFNNKLDIFLSPNRSILYLCGLYGIVSLKMPSFYFVNQSTGKLSLLFVRKFFYMSFLKHLTTNYKNLFNIYVINIRVKGLGYRIRKVVNNLYYFFFNYTNMYYFYIPNNILVKWHKKRLVMFSDDFVLLKMVFSNILLLKNIGPYRLRGIRYPRQIILLKKGGKTV